MRHHALSAVCCIGLFCPAAALADFESPSAGPEPEAGLPEMRPWDASIRLFVGHNDNVPLAPDATFFSGERESAFGGISLDATYRLVQSADWTAGVALTLDRLAYSETGTPNPAYDPPEQYDLIALNPSLFALRHFRLANGMPAQVGISYGFRREWLPVHAGGLKSHDLKLKAAVNPRPDLTLGASYTYGRDDFEVEFPDPTLDDRDATRHAFGLSATYYWDDRLRSVSVSYTRAVNNADGSNFEYDANIFTGRFESHLYGPLWLGLEVSRDNRDYDGFVGFIAPPGRTDQDITRYGAELLWQIDRSWTADAYYTKSRYDASQPEFKADRAEFGIGITYRF